MDKSTAAFAFLVFLLLGGGVLFFVFSRGTAYHSQPLPMPYQTYPTQLDSSTSTDATSVVSGINQFSFDLYKHFSSEDGNVFLSPYSVFTALAMTTEGANGATKDEMRKVLHLPSDNELHAGMKNFTTALIPMNDTYELKSINALWVQKDFSLLSKYQQTIADYYQGKAQNLDFKNNAEASRATINSAIAAATNEKIKNLIPEGILNQDTRLVLTNAIYFKGVWAKPFETFATTNTPFTLSSGTKKQVPMMGQTEHFAYMENSDLQMVSLPYRGGVVTMMVLLPKDNNLKQLESKLTAETIEQWRKELVSQSVQLSLPKFTFETKYFMSKDLPEMGIKTAFTNQADFSGMTKEDTLKIDEVIHQTFIGVDEKGTEAAAATAVSMTAAGMPARNDLKIFKADHPFIFMIRDEKSGAILFVGRVSDPKR